MATTNPDSWLNRYLTGKQPSLVDEYIATSPSGKVTENKDQELKRKAAWLAKYPDGVGYLQNPITSLDESLDLNLLNPEFQDTYIEGKDPRQLTPQEMFQQAMRMRQEQGQEAVNLRKVQQEEMGMRSRYPNLDQASIIDDSVRTRLRQAMMPQPVMGQLPVETRALPGIGNVAMYPQGERTVTGRYGVGSAANTPPKERYIMENGKKVDPTAWFQDAARRQGESNKFANKQGRKIVDDKKVA